MSLVKLDNTGKNDNVNIIEFYDPKKPYGWGSNFYPIKNLVIDGERWLTTESYFQAMKFRGPSATPRSIQYSNLIKDADGPAKVAMLGRQKKNLRFGKTWVLNKAKDRRIVNDLIDEYSSNVDTSLNVSIRKDWRTASVRAMMTALIDKFTQNPELLKAITNIPDNSYLVEHTSRDSIWGDGGDGSGSNYLGKILTALSIVLKYGSCKGISRKLKSMLVIKM
jgi:predicted NAD-dependent protein-ADP-ribosyltransferase YbiA (DUF1768 family)